MGSLAMKATERDPAFIKNFEAAVGGGMFAKRKQSTRGALDWGVWVRWRHSSRMPHAHPGASSLPPRSPRHPPEVIVACSVGGTLDTIVRVAANGKSAKDPDRSFGRETRSLKAAYELLQAGYSNVVHLQGGLSSWRYNGCVGAQGVAGG